MIISPLIIQNTLVGRPRLEFIKTTLDRIASVTGCNAEVGIYRGGTAALILQQSDKRLYLFDTFEGLPPVAAVDRHHKGEFKNTSIKSITDLLDQFGKHYAIYKGIFPRQNSEYLDFRLFSLAHIDVDIYPSVKECLEFFHPRMSPGGVILLDDYNAPACPGAKLAADEFYVDKPQKVIPTVQCQAMVQY